MPAAASRHPTRPLPLPRESSRQLPRPRFSCPSPPPGLVKPVRCSFHRTCAPPLGHTFCSALSLAARTRSMRQITEFPPLLPIYTSLSFAGPSSLRLFVLVNHAFLHHKKYLFRYSYVLQRIPRYCH